MAGEGGTDLGAGQQAGDTRLEGEELKVVDVRDTKTQVVCNLFEHKLPPFPWWRVVGMVVCGVVLVPVRAVLTLLVLLLAWLVSAMGLLCRDKETMSTQPQVQATPPDPDPPPLPLHGCLVAPPGWMARGLQGGGLLPHLLRPRLHPRPPGEGGGEAGPPRRGPRGGVRPSHLLPRHPGGLPLQGLRGGQD